MSLYKVKSNLKHDGQTYTKGQEVELKEDDAAQLISDGIVADPKAKVEDDSTEEAQPAVNNVKREGGDVNGKANVEEGAKNEPVEDDKKNDKEEGKDAPKSQYKVLQELEYPKGTTHKVDAVLELTDEEARKFGDGLLEKVEDNL